MEGFELKWWTEPIQETPFLFLIYRNTREHNQKWGTDDGVVFLEHTTALESKKKDFLDAPDEEDSMTVENQQCVALRENWTYIYGLDAFMAM